MGYGIVLLMTIFGLAAVLVAIVLDGRAGSGPESWPGDGTSRFLALARSSVVEASWAKRLVAEAGGVADARLVDVPNLPLGDVCQFVVSAAVEHRADVAVFWTALDDVLGGVRLEDHERALGALLADFETRGVIAVVGNAPDLSRLGVAAESGLPAEELALLTNRWNSAIARLAYHHSAHVVDLFDVADDLAATGGPTHPDELDVSETVFVTAVVERFVSVLTQAVADADDRPKRASLLEPL